MDLLFKILAFILYLGVMIFIGLRVAKKNSGPADFFLGGRRLGPWLSALSAEASDSSAWLLMGLPGLCYLGGFRETFWTALGLVLGTYLSWLLIAKSLRKCSIAFGDSITIPEFLTNRFNDKTHILLVVSVLFIVFFFTIYTASGFVACGKLFNSVFGLNYRTGVFIGFAVILAYTITGGYLAVCTTDFLQGTLIFVAFVISSILIVVSLGGPADAIAQTKEFTERALNGEFGAEMLKKFSGNKTYGFFSAISAVAWGLGYFGMPHFIIRFMGIRSNSEIKKARRIGISWMIISYIGTFLIGTLGTAYLLNHQIILGGGTEETVFSETMLQMYPPFLAGLFLCAILAASMSTADSQLLVASSAVSQDIFKGLIKKDASEKMVLLVSRIVVFLVAMIALFFAFDENSSIFSLVSYAWAGFGGTFGPLILLALYCRSITNTGAISGLIVGGITVVVWHNLSGGIFQIYEILPAFIINLFVTLIVSAFTKKDPKILSAFENYRAQKD